MIVTQNVFLFCFRLAGYTSYLDCFLRFRASFVLFGAVLTHFFYRYSQTPLRDLLYFIQMHCRQFRER